MKKIKNKTLAMKQIEEKLGGDIEEILRILYVDEHLPINTICEKLEISYVTTIKWLKKAGIYSRNLGVGS